MTQWLQQNTPLHAPHLLPYEVANALTRSIVAGQFSEADLAPALDSLGNLPIVYHALSYNPRVVEIALSLRRQSAYDAAYIALAESLNAELWTLDSPLYRNAAGLGFPVRLIRTD
jgi:predicted nucleic acid-binding protein